MRSEHRITEKSKDFLIAQNHKLEFMKKSIENMNPENVLRRGYSISLLNGKSITDTSQVKGDDKIETILFKGEIISTVESTIKNKEI